MVFKFQIGAIGLPDGTAQSTELFETFGGCVADAAVSLFGQMNPAANRPSRQ